MTPARFCLSFVAGIGAMLLGLAGLNEAGEKSKTSSASLPPWKRYLKGEERGKAMDLEDQWTKAWEAGNFHEALKAAALAITLAEP